MKTDCEKLFELAETLKVDIETIGNDEDDMYKLYDNMLNECHERPKVGCCEMDPARFLEENDPTAYRCGFSDWTDSVQDEYFEHGDRWYDADAIDEVREEIKDAIDRI